MARPPPSARRPLGSAFRLDSPDIARTMAKTKKSPRKDQTGSPAKQHESDDRKRRDPHGSKDDHAASGPAGPTSTQAASTPKRQKISAGDEPVPHRPLKIDTTQCGARPIDLQTPFVYFPNESIVSKMRDQGKRHHKEQLESLRFREPNLSPQQTSPVLSPTNPRRVLRIANGRILRNHALITDDLWIEDGKIINPAPVFWDAKSKPHMVVDAHGAIISPGYIDLQINGAFGVDFSDADDLEKKLPALKKALLKSGCTGFCPTIVSTSPEQYRKLIPKLQPSAGSIRNGAANLGIHLEGPFISPKVAGAHPSDIVREAPGSWKDFATTYGFDRDDCERRRGNGDGEIAQRAVRMITCAPEVQGVMKTIPDLVRRGFVVSVGYTNSTTAEAEEAISSGASFVTHLFNGMQPFHHRDPGTIGLLGSTKPSKRPFYGIICDGLHSHPFSVRIAHNAHRDGIVLVTDAIPAAGMPPGKYKFSSTVTEKHKDAAYIEGSDALAGSVIMMDECVRNFKKFSRCTTVEALEAATLNPAQVLGIQKTKGTLDFGADADLLFLDDDLNVKRVFIAGKELV